jgi:ABC-2 type transport system ATP-binding protein
METAIRVEGLFKTFQSGWVRRRRLPVLRDLRLAIPAGTIFGILGPNGAGKTTLISILATLLLPDAGMVEVLGLDVRRQAAKVRRRINLASGAAKFVWSLTVLENLRFYGHLYGLWGRQLAVRVEEMVALFELQEYRHSPFETLSSGLKQRLALAKALISRPELLFLDEPTNGLDPIAAQHSREEILRLNQQTGVTIILTTHNLREAEQLCQEVGFLGEGRILAQGSIRALQTQLGLGDRVILEGAGPLPRLAYQQLPGVLRCRQNETHLELILDHSDSRLPLVIQEINQAGGLIRAIRVEAADLEDLFREFSR